MKKLTMTVEILVSVNDDVDPHDIRFAGIEDAVPMVEDKAVGTVIEFCTQEYFGEGT